ncbi:MAG: phosphatidylserine decarboxylase family protein [Elusimicrobia bacterium CG08_land_8_20_14_0_20_51_18]|nr:MAG: phosphatidylserine decarboxylase family protein [Elusimicrobia bacterium CG08_land_8_20_14_0_20_51_18]
MGIVPEGVKLLAVGTAGLLASVFLSIYSKWLGIPLLTVFFIFTVFSMYFFRDPLRDRAFAQDQIASPADGTILSIRQEEREGIVVIRIFLSIFNVHLQRAPIAGKIAKIKFTQGKFAIAYKPEAKDNQRNLIRIEGEKGRAVEVEQITGAIARRIVSYVKEGESVDASRKIGMIYFGSQVALYLPKDVKLLVKEGDKVAAGETVIGAW